MDDQYRTYLELLHLYWHCKYTKEQIIEAAKEFTIQIDLDEVCKNNPYDQDDEFIEDFHAVIREYYPDYFQEIDHNSKPNKTLEVFIMPEEMKNEVVVATLKDQSGKTWDESFKTEDGAHHSAKERGLEVADLGEMYVSDEDYEKIFGNLKEAAKALTVKEARELLSHFDDDATIMLLSNDGFQLSKVEGIERDKDKNIVYIVESK